MNLSLLAPLRLAALAAMALPLLIHLIRRLELTTTDFAALRWISERVTARRRLRFERPWLLLLRLLLLALLALLLARPVMTEPSAPARARVVVAAGVDRTAAVAAVGNAAADWRWLAPGFPSLDVAPPAGTAPLASLLRELDADLPAASGLTVVVPSELAGLDGERPHLGRTVDWRVLPGGMASSASSVSNAPIRLAVRSAPAGEASLRYLRAAIAAWNAREPGRYLLDAQPLSIAIHDDEHWLIWLGADLPVAIASWIEQGGTAVLADRPEPRGDVVWRDASGHALAQRYASGRGRIVALHGTLIPQALPIMLDADFPERLLALMREAPPAPTRAIAEAMRPLQEVTAASAAMLASGSARPLDSWLAVLIAGLFLLERLLATRTRAEVVE
ncbi:MAG: BatA domain-containing protein [Dokdonella sp.]